MCCSDTAYSSTEIAECTNAASYASDVTVSTCSVSIIYYLYPCMYACLYTLTCSRSNMQIHTYIHTYIHTRHVYHTNVWIGPWEVAAWLGERAITSASTVGNFLPYHSRWSQYWKLLYPSIYLDCMGSGDRVYFAVGAYGSDPSRSVLSARVPYIHTVHTYIDMRDAY